MASLKKPPHCGKVFLKITLSSTETSAGNHLSHGLVERQPFFRFNVLFEGHDLRTGSDLI